MYTIIGKIDNFDRKKSYSGFERKSPVAVEAKVNKCVSTKVARKKRGPNVELKEAKLAWKKAQTSHN